MEMSSTTLIAILGLILLVLVFGALTSWFTHHPERGWQVLFVSVAASSALALPSVGVGPLQLGPLDLLTWSLLGAALLRGCAHRRWAWPLLALLALYGLNIARSITQFGLGGADLEFRSELAVLSCALFAASLSARHIEGASRDIRRLSSFYVGLAAVRWILLTAGLADGAAWTNEVFGVPRVLNSAETLTVLIGLFITLWFWWEGRPVRAPITSVTAFAIVVLVAQHRSVWVAGALGVVVLVAKTKARGRQRTALLAGALLVTVAVNLAGQGLLGGFGDSISTAASDARTWEWRQERWETVWDEHSSRGLESLTVGSTYGTPWVVEEASGGERSVSPHSYYVRILVRLGAVGALAFFGLVLSLLAVALRSRSPWASLFASLTVVQLAFFVPYDATVVSAVALGLTVSWATTRAAGHRQTPAAPAREVSVS
jgi:hypothetical protein